MTQEEITVALQEANDLKHSGDYARALQILEEIFQVPGNQNNQTLVYNLMFVLQKTGDIQRALEMGLHACDLPDAWDGIRQSTAWCIYHRIFRDIPSLEAESAVEWLERLRAIFPQRAGLHPLPLALFTWLAKHPEAQPQLIVHLCGLLDPALLDATPVPPRDGSPGYPSQREKYTSILSKALFAVERYRDCLDLCCGALNAGLPLTGNNWIWLRRRIALCKSKLGEHAQALAEMRELLIKKKDWFLYHEAAEIAWRLNDLPAALELAARATLAFGEIENKIHLWELLQQILARNKQYDHALSLLRLIASIRRFKGWNISAKLRQELASYNIDPDQLPHFKAIYASLKPILENFLQSGGERLNGRIFRILPDNKAGFISGARGSYYFRMSELRFPREKAVPGLAVSFVTEKSFDRKKQRDSVIAVGITLG